MTVETATYLKHLNPSYPEDGDLIKEGDDHIRLIKKTLRNTFKNIDRQVLLSSEQLNDLVNYKDYINSSLEKAHPVGSVYISVNNTNPNSSLGFGTWVAISQGRVLMGVGTGNDTHSNRVNFSGGETGGEYSTKILPSNTPQKGHNHAIRTVVNAASKTLSYLTTVPVFKSFKMKTEDILLKKDPMTLTAFKAKYGDVMPYKDKYADPVVGYTFVKNAFTSNTPSVQATATATRDSSSGVTPINNIQPYLAVYMWKRTS